MGDAAINLGALEPLFGPSEPPNRHRVRAKVAGEPAEVVNGRRPSPIEIAQNLRRDVADWRSAFYGGASDTTVELLSYWFHRDHDIRVASGDRIPFAYYFCQREAIETLVYLYEVRGIRSLQALTAEYRTTNAQEAALGIDPKEDQWSKYAFKVATGAGKTKVMSLAIVWSYFHALRESDSPMTRHFVVIAPGITVFERLKEDFGSGRIFETDPLIPPAWKGDWNMSVVLQDEAGGVATGGTIYLTNIHRLHEKRSRGDADGDSYDWMGPKVSKAKALDTSEALRQRITAHPRVMVLNDEAHHVWDPDSAWNEAIAFLHETTRKRGGGVVAQLDFSATPRDNKGNVFRHVVCDTPLGEAVDGGIVKSPVIGRGNLITRVHEDASHKYEHHLKLGYERWRASSEEWSRSGKKALLFVMTESTEAADSIAHRLNTDPAFSELNDKTINLHTNLKGKVKSLGRGKNAPKVFVESEKEISDEDLKELRKLSRELDSDASPYRCIVSVLMLREGWDVRNVTTIVPLRPFTAESKILPEQTLGRGLRRMTPPGEVAEVVTVVEHSQFISLYEEELSQEGLPIEVVDIDKVPKTTVTIYPDGENKDLEALELRIPRLSQSYRIDPALTGELTFNDVRNAFAHHFDPLPIGEASGESEIDYEGRHLITNELVEKMKVKLELLQDGMGAVSFFREELERAVGVRGQHATLAPLIQKFIEEVLFGETLELYDPRVLARLDNIDVRQHLRATFVPLLRSRVTTRNQRLKEAEPLSLSTWRPFQVTHSEKRPTKTAAKTLFNLVPCSNALEAAMSDYCNRADDVVAFAKNAGPQALRVDYLNSVGRRSIYTPDFLVRMGDGSYFLVETKGRADKDVPAKAKAAIEWCTAASRQKTTWTYLYVPQDVFEQLTGSSFSALARACKPSLAELLREGEAPGQKLLFGQDDAGRWTEQVQEFIDPQVLEALPSRYRKAIEDALKLFFFVRTKSVESLAPVFQPLLGPIDHAAESLVRIHLAPHVPAEAGPQKDFFEPDLSAVPKKKLDDLRTHGERLRRFLVFNSLIMPTGLLWFCLRHAEPGKPSAPGIFAAIQTEFGRYATTGLKDEVKSCYDFRNTRIAHQKDDDALTDLAEAGDALKGWIRTLLAMHRSLQAAASPDASVKNVAEPPKPPYGSEG